MIYWTIVCALSSDILDYYMTEPSGARGICLVLRFSVVCWYICIPRRRGRKVYVFFFWYFLSCCIYVLCEMALWTIICPLLKGYIILLKRLEHEIFVLVLPFSVV